MPLQHVTFTGWDRHTDRAGLANFLSTYPAGQIEIAVLISRGRAGDDRYPHHQDADAILRAAREGRQLTAAHLCGSVASDLIDPMPVGRIHELRLWLAGPAVGRVQINVPEKAIADSHWLRRRAADLAQELGKPVILQTRDPAHWPEPFEGVQYLYDRSAGNGVPMIEFPMPPTHTFVGYAGGLGPGNVGALVHQLDAEDAGVRYWIDMETGIRESMSAFPGGPRGTADQPAPTFISIHKVAAVMAACRSALERAA